MRRPWSLRPPVFGGTRCGTEWSASFATIFNVIRKSWLRSAQIPVVSVRSARRDARSSRPTTIALFTGPTLNALTDF